MKNTTKVMGIGLVLSFALALLVSVPSASAYTQNITVGENLTVGSTGSGVVVLQGLMTELGFLNVPANIPLGYFGEMTKDAVARYQASQGVTPTAGYFGPISKNAMHQQFALHGWNNLLGW